MPTPQNTGCCCFIKWFKIQIYNCAKFTVYKKKWILILTNSCNWDFFYFFTCVYSDFLFIYFFKFFNFFFIFSEKPKAFSSFSRLICLPAWHETQVADFILGSKLVTKVKVPSLFMLFANNRDRRPYSDSLPQLIVFGGVKQQGVPCLSYFSARHQSYHLQ